jgi:RNA polymerase sigma factor (sigma-70 family)
MAAISESVDLYGDPKEPLLAPDMLRELIVKAKAGDELAKQRVILANIGLARKAAFKYHRVVANTGIDIRDLFQEALIGVNRAVELFEPDRGFTFSTYAHNWVQQAIVTYLRKNSGTITTPECAHGTRLVEAIKEEFEAKNGREPTPDEICEIGRFPLSSLDRYLAPEVYVTSYHQLTARASVDGGEPENEIIDVLAPPQSDEADGANKNIDLQRAIADLNLSDVELSIVEMNFGFGPYFPTPVNVIAKQVGKKPREVGYILESVVLRLRGSLHLSEYASA